MYAALLPAMATCGVALSLAALVLARRERASIHWVYLGLLVSISVWTGGVVWRHTQTSDEGVRHALDVIWLGVFSAPVLWFWLAALYTRSSLSQARWLPLASVALPAAGYLAWCTNDLHGLFASEVSDAAMRAGPRVFGGPFFWMVMTWTLAFAVAGVGLMLGHAWKLRGRERSRSIELAVAALAPLALAQVYLFRLLPVPYDLTPTGFCVTTLIFYGLLAREGIFEALPLARRDVIEDLPDGVIIADREGVVLDTNPAGRALLGAAGGPPVGRSLTAVLVASAVEEAEDDVVREVARVLTEGGPGFAAFDTRAGRRVQLSVATVRSRGGRPAGVYAVMRDCTEQYRYEQIVRQSQKLESVGVLAAGVAHEVNNPLAFIQANLGSLQQMADTVERNLHRLPEKDATELAELREVLDDSLEGITRISRIVNRLRRFSRTPDERWGPLDPNAVVEEAVRFARLDREGGWRFAADLQPDLPPVYGSRDGLTQVLLNLAMNAAHAVHGRPDGRIEIASRRDGDSVWIRVRDNGPGVPEPIQRHIFDPFFTTKPPDEGTGLGLAIAFDIAREHGGRLELCDEVGDGACFCLWLPVAEERIA
jgi:two-component system NtrC family sensor kinase